MILQTIYLHSLGCEKNTVDAEHILSIIKDNGFSIIEEPLEADIIIINTCAFIEDAKKESINSIFDHSLFKQYGKCKRLIVSGCLSERYKESFLDMFSEVDSAIGIHNLEDILKAIKDDGFFGEKESSVYREYKARENTGSDFSSYIRISDGCHANCSFCAIPAIRGIYRSRTIENIISEARLYAEKGVKELNLIAQETTYYGKDLYDKLALPDLLKQISLVDGIEWIRVLYHNPVILNDSIIESFFNTPKVLPYFDIPLQHVNESVLKDMNRAGSYESNKRLIDTIRGYDKNAAIRSSFIVGFPGEGKDEFRELLSFIKECEIDRVGVFGYSEEENTKSLLINKKKADKGKKLHRCDMLMERAIKVSERRLKRFVGATLDVLITDLDKDNNLIGRTKYDAPEVDGVVYVNSHKNTNVKLGDIIKVKISHNNEHDLFGE